VSKVGSIPGLERRTSRTTDYVMPGGINALEMSKKKGTLRVTPRGLSGIWEEEFRGKQGKKH